MNDPRASQQASTVSDRGDASETLSRSIRRLEGVLPDLRQLLAGTPISERELLLRHRLLQTLDAVARILSEASIQNGPELALEFSRLCTDGISSGAFRQPEGLHDH